MNLFKSDIAEVPSSFFKISLKLWSLMMECMGSSYVICDPHPHNQLFFCIWPLKSLKNGKKTVKYLTKFIDIYIYLKLVSSALKPVSLWNWWKCLPLKQTTKSLNFSCHKDALLPAHLELETLFRQMCWAWKFKVKPVDDMRLQQRNAGLPN